MSIKTQLIKYLAESFKPIRITASRDAWRKVNYQNPIFTVQVSYYQDGSFMRVVGMKQVSAQSNVFFYVLFSVSLPKFDATPINIFIFDFRRHSSTA